MNVHNKVQFYFLRPKNYKKYLHFRAKLLRFNEGFQQQWQREKAAKANTIPFSLLNLLGVAGTTKVTQAEIDALPSEEE